ncbi:hypothetical protein ACFWIQ_19895 [Kitasatospora sp. NPDC127059]|uniref:hypothetical protein n=1 Tax=unclassified Kitasatospora TaxID=2633591 RepID=UPI003650F32F
MLKLRHPRRRWFRRPLVLFAGATALAGALAAGAVWAAATPGEGERPVTTDEAGLLAVSRLTTFEASPLRVRITVPAPGRAVVVDGLVDYRSHHAVGAYHQRDGGTDGLLVWDDRGLGLAPGAATDTPARTAADLPHQAWSPRAYTADPLDAALRLAMALGADRPDNPQLLAQAGPRRLRTATLGGHRYTVFAGPPPAEGARPHLRYWVDADGRLGRVEADLPGLSGPAVVEPAGRADGEQVPNAPWQALPPQAP